MWKIRTFVILLVTAGTFGGVALVPAISLAQSNAQSAIDKTKSTAKDVSKWSRKEWNTAKAKWVKEKERWNTCNKEAADKKLRGRKSWSFIYDCMTG